MRADRWSSNKVIWEIYFWEFAILGDNQGVKTFCKLILTHYNAESLFCKSSDLTLKIIFPLSDGNYDFVPKYS